MRGVKSLLVAVLVLVVLASPTVVLADGRVALVVDNSTYAHIGRLPNPDNDAADMSAARTAPGHSGYMDTPEPTRSPPESRLVRNWCDHHSVECAGIDG